jgi:isoleucyl-tRNA synthetase
MVNKQNNEPKAKSFFPELEEEVLRFWDKAKIFEQSVEREAPQGDYVFYDGPPFGTGEPHYGHILSSVSKDVVPRYWTMRGFRVERKWGWDCHGLPIENIIEADLKISGKKQIEKMGVDKFNEACRTRVLEYADIWDVMIRRIGRWVDFKNSYKTMDLTYMESVWWGFKELWKKDLVYEGKKVLLYCPRCETPISNFEVAMDNSYKDVTETSVYVKFKLTGAKEKLGIDGNVYVLAWTTTPWTLPGNVALAVGEKIEYYIAEIKENSIENLNLKNGDFVIFAKDLKAPANSPIQALDFRPNPPSLTVNRYIYGSGAELIEFINIKTVTGQQLLNYNLEYEPLFDVKAQEKENAKGYYVVAGDFVTTEDGTGIVHIAPAYGEDDYKLGLKYSLPVISTLDEKGHFTNTVPQLEGQYFKKANVSVIEYLDQRKLLFAKQETTHSYPHCHRCETPLYYNAIPAWFINIDKIRKRMLELNEKINWYPDNLKLGRFTKGIEQAPDWNISRNRYFATPIPIWRCGKCSEMEVVGSIDELKEKSGAAEVNDIHNHHIDHLVWQCGKCGGEMQRIKEVFDCWVESGSMPFAQLHYPFENKEKFEDNFPAQFISEYISQTRAWFYVTHVLSSALFDSNAFENVVTTGVILNEKGEKMSKSKKNFPDPNKLIDEYGADALRYYLMNSSVMHADNLFFNEKEVMEVFRKINMILWNVYKFYEMYAEAVESPASPAGGRKSKVESDNILDRWIIARLNQLIAEVTKQMNGYDLLRSVRPISDFINDLSTWYLRRSRDRFKSDDQADKKAALETTAFVLIGLSKVMAPFMPFIAEQIWQKGTGNNFQNDNKSVHLEAWPESYDFDKAIIRQMNLIRKIVEAGLAARDAVGIKIRQPLPYFSISNLFFNEIYGSNDQGFEQVKKEIEPFMGLVKDELNILEIRFGADELGTELTEELKLDGVRRELVRSINNLRKNAGLTIADRVAIFWSIGEADFAAPMAKQVFEKFGEEIKKDTLADSIEHKHDQEAPQTKEVKINGETVWLGIKKVDAL